MIALNPAFTLAKVISQNELKENSIVRFVENFASDLDRQGIDHIHFDTTTIIDITDPELIISMLSHNPFDLWLLRQLDLKREIETHTAFLPYIQKYEELKGSPLNPKIKIVFYTPT